MTNTCSVHSNWPKTCDHWNACKAQLAHICLALKFNRHGKDSLFLFIDSQAVAMNCSKIDVLFCVLRHEKFLLPVLTTNSGFHIQHLKHVLIKTQKRTKKENYTKIQKTKHMKWERDFDVIIATLSHTRSEKFSSKRIFFLLKSNESIFMNEIHWGLDKTQKRSLTRWTRSNIITLAHKQFQMIGFMFTVISIWLAIH